MNDPIIRAEGLAKKYPRKTALDGLTFTLPGDGITGLVGRNGAGKTTLMKLCAGMLNKTGGTIQVFGGDPMDNLHVLSKLVYSHHELSFTKSLKLRQILENHQIMLPTFDLEFAEKLLGYFDLDEKAKFSQLSHGMTTTFRFVCGLASRVPLTLFDEPVLGMDIAVRKAAYEVLLREYAEHPRCFVISSHLLSEIEGVLSDILLIDGGKLLLHQSMEELHQSAYRLEGEPDALDKFNQGRNVIWRTNGETGSAAVIYEKADEEAAENAARLGLRLSAVRAEDLCVYLTRENKEEELSCLWQKAN